MEESERLKILARLKKQGLISAEEFQGERGQSALEPPVYIPGGFLTKIGPRWWLAMGIFLLLLAIGGVGSEGFTVTVLAMALLALMIITIALSDLIKQRAVANLLQGKILNILGIPFAALVIYTMTKSTQGTGFMRGLVILMMIGVIAICFYNLKQKDS